MKTETFFAILASIFAILFIVALFGDMLIRNSDTKKKIFLRCPGKNLTIFHRVISVNT